MRAEISVCLPECTAKRLDDPAKTSHLTKAAPIIQGMEFIPAPTDVQEKLAVTMNKSYSWIRK